MLTFLQFLAEKYLEEKLILYNQGKRYGQIVFLAGGAGSGKGFAIRNFMEKEKFKVRDVDAWKEAFMKLADATDKYPEIKGLSLKKPRDVAKIHQFVKDKGIKEKSLDLLLRDVNVRNAPNVIFDITMKDTSNIDAVIPKLLEVGYNPKNIHLTWVLTNYYIAIENNQKRTRTVADDIMLLSHEGAATSMYEVIKGKIPRGLDGGVRVILNNRDNTIPWLDPDTKKPMKTKQGDIIVKDFTYLTLKKEGKRIGPEMGVKRQILGWIEENVPDTKLTRELIPTESDV